MKLPNLPWISAAVPLFQNPLALLAGVLVLAAPAIASAQTCMTPPSGAVAWWSFDETSGNIASDRLGLSPGAWTNGPVPMLGEVRGALSFNGSSYVTVQDSALWNFGANDFTIELWANFSAPPGGSVGEPAAILIGNDEGGGDRNKWFFAVGGGYLYFHINSPTLGPQFFPLVPFSPTVGRWYHLAVVRTGSTYTVFINGVASGSATNANVIPDPNAPLTMGESENIGFMQGSLDEVTVYNRGLLPGEIQAIYNAASSGKCINIQVSPNAGGDTGNVSVNINGIGFQQGATVSLAMTGQTSIVGSPATVGANGTTISTTFSLAGQTDGAWDVVVTNPGGTSFTLPKGFTIQPGTSPQVWVDIVGIGLIEPGRAQAFQIFYGNSGNIDAVGVPLWIAGVPPDATLNLGFNVVPPLPWTNPSSDYSQVPTSYNTGTDIEAAFLMPVIPAGSTGALQITITVPEMENFQLQAWTNPPWFGTSPATSMAFLLGDFLGAGVRAPQGVCSQQTLSSRPLASPADFNSFLGCAVSLVNALYKNPALDCVKSRAGILQEFVTNESLKNKVINFFWVFVDVAANCSQGAVCDTCVDTLFEPIPCAACIAAILESKGNQLIGAYKSGADCANVGLQIGEVALSIISINSFDPNNKVGPQGFGSSRFVSGQQPLHYSVSFENDPTATAPAQQVVITDQLDPTKVDLSTLSLGAISFGSNQVIPPPDSTTFATTVSLQPAQNLNVKITGSLDPNTGLLTWILSSIDPTTGNPPTDPAVGFLPPDVTPPQGDGSVLFTVMPKKGLTTGTQITNQATIVFDANAPIATPSWLNTLDVTPPVSKVAPLPPTEPATSGTATFTVSWSGTDKGSGIATYTIYVSDNGGPFTVWQSAVAATSASYTGAVGDTYGFYSIATDNVGNVEAAKTTADATTSVVTPPQAQVSATLLQYDTLAFGSAETMPLTVTNIGGGTLTIAPTINGPSYTITSSTCTGGVTAGNNCTLQVEFTPFVVGTHDDILTLQTNGSTNPTVPLDGLATGIGTELEVPLQFGTIPLGTTEVLPLTISNVGVPGPVTFTAASNGPSYKVLTTAQNTCLAGITAGQKCTLPVEFDPAVVGSHNDLLTLTPSAGAQPSQVRLDGIASGVGTEIETPLQFGTIPFGTTEVLTLKVTNIGVPGTVTLETTINGPSYKIVTTTQNTCMAGISAGQSCTLPVEFDPVDVGRHSDILTLTPSGGAASSTVSLQGFAD